MFFGLGADTLPVCRAGEPYYSDGAGGYYNDTQGSCTATGGASNDLPLCLTTEQIYADGGGGFYTDSQGSCLKEYPSGGGGLFGGLDTQSLMLIGGIGALALVLMSSMGGSGRRR